MDIDTTWLSPNVIIILNLECLYIIMSQRQDNMKTSFRLEITSLLLNIYMRVLNSVLLIEQLEKVNACGILKLYLAYFRMKSILLFTE